MLHNLRSIPPLLYTVKPPCLCPVDGLGQRARPYAKSFCGQMGSQRAWNRSRRKALTSYRWRNSIDRDAPNTQGYVAVLFSFVVPQTGRSFSGLIFHTSSYGSQAFWSTKFSRRLRRVLFCPPLANKPGDRGPNASQPLLKKYRQLPGGGVASDQVAEWVCVKPHKVSGFPVWPPLPAAAGD